MLRYVTIKQVVPADNYRLQVKFSTGEEGVFDLTPWLHGRGYSQLRTPELFNQVQLDEVAGTICWPNGIDFDPLILYQHTEFTPEVVLV